ncbi:MAG: cytochrome c-type biogenesis protein [Usitatibacter sp.]
MRTFLAIAALVFASLAFGQAEEIARPDAKVEARLKALAEELRCLVCQNQTIADSNAPLALDLRNQIRTQIAQGRSDTEIREYMVDRYGDFVLYRPPFKATTVLLWIGPFALLAFGIGVAAVVARRRRAQPRPAADTASRAEIAAMLEGGNAEEVATQAPPRRGGASRP